MHFEIIGEIDSIETIAAGGRIRDIMRLRLTNMETAETRRLCGCVTNTERGGGVAKGNAHVRLARGMVRRAELHWYEAHGIGRKKIKVKRFLD